MYSNQQMKDLCLTLAESGDQVEAEALRTLASNYDDAAEPEPKEYELRFWHMVLAVIAVYAILTPFYFFGPQEVSDPPPEGRKVEQLSGFEQTSDGRYTTRTYKFARGTTFASGVREWTFDEDPVPLVVFEGRSALPKESFEVQELNEANIWRYVTINISDGTDPNKNGRRYYIVLP